MEIVPENLDIVIRNNDFAVYNGNSVLLTSEGSEVAHTNQRLLQQILREFVFPAGNNDSAIQCFTLFCHQKDFVESGLDILSRNFNELLAYDPFIRKKYLKDQTDFHQNSLADLTEFDSGKVPLHFSYSGSAVVSRVFSDFINEKMPKNFDISTLNFSQVSEIIFEYYLRLGNEKKTAINLMAKYHLAGIITPMLLADSKITPSEYANAVFNLNQPHFRNDSLFAGHLNLLEIENAGSFKELNNLTKDNFSKIKNEALATVEYIDLSNSETVEESDISKLLTGGENYNTEFKSTLRMNLKSGKKDPNIEHASLKTIAAFLNSSGGNLLIGVRDDSSIEGIETDDFENEDRFSLHFWNLVKSSMGQDVSVFLKTAFERIDNKNVFIIKCAQSTRPVFLKQSGFGEEFFIRVGPGSAKLEISEALKYTGERFGKN